MPIREHPRLGTVLLCDFNAGFRMPEMVKRRPVVVVSPRIVARPGLCTIVALSTRAPDPVMPYHRQIDLRPRLPRPWTSDGIWVKGDMVNAVGFHRLDLFRLGKNDTGKRIYLYDHLSDGNIKIIRRYTLRAIGLSTLTKHFPFRICSLLAALAWRSASKTLTGAAVEGGYAKSHYGVDISSIFIGLFVVIVLPAPKRGCCYESACVGTVYGEGYIPA